MFFISLLLIVFSSYLITSFLMKDNVKQNTGILYFFLICFAQIVLSFEILSLFKAISCRNFIIANIIFVIISLFIPKNLYKPNFTSDIKKIKNALKCDKILKYIFYFFIFFLICEVVSMTVFPACYGDALACYLPRVTSWFQYGSINHFFSPDIREVIMPVNMDLLYLWYLMFRKEEAGIGIFSFISYLCSLYTLYHFLGELGFCTRKRLWGIFVFSSFAIIGIMSVVPTSDLFTGTLLLVSLYLYLISVKYKNVVSLYISSLSLALAISTKTIAIIACPSLIFVFLIISFLYRKQTSIYLFFKFIFFFIVNFLIFSSYNYILNYIDFNNPVSSIEHYMIHKFRGGLKGYIFSLLNYTFLIFDFSGINIIDFYNKFITDTLNHLISLLDKNPNRFMSPFFMGLYEYNSNYSPVGTGLGVMGLIAFVPALFYTFFMGLKKIGHKCSQRFIILFLLALFFIFNFIIFPLVMAFIKYNVRYFVNFLVVTSPILIFTYIKSNKNFYKILTSFFIFIYLFVIPFKDNLSYIYSYINFKVQNPEVKNAYEKLFEGSYDENLIYNYLVSENKENILFLPFNIGNKVFYVEKLKLKGWNIDKLPIENIKSYNLENYKYIIAGIPEIKNENIKNPNNTECDYMDYMKNIIAKNDDNAVKIEVKCKTPIDYFKQQGFEPLKDLIFANYLILKKTK